MSNVLIYRQDAINALGEEPEVWSGNDEYAQGLNNQWHYDVNAIKAVLPAQPELIEKAVYIRGFEQGRIQGIVDERISVQPERKKGKWIVHYECPKCGEITKDFTEYCPFCNADMRGEEDE